MRRLIERMGGTAHDLSTAVCGQLNVMPMEVARSIPMPAGLPVEDGFIRAMALTQNLTHEEDFSRVTLAEGVTHEYLSESTVHGVLSHEVRIMVGSSVNTGLFRYFRRVGPEAAAREIDRQGDDCAWLRSVLARQLPARYGWVPADFLVRRLRERSRPPHLLAVGVLFDAVTYVRAQWLMCRGKAVNYW